MSKHTSGPWIVRNRDSVYAESGRFVADCELTPYTARPKPPIGEDAANANLIAAAPAMYEALRAIIEDNESLRELVNSYRDDLSYSPFTESEAVIRGRQALAQADGQG